jgi:hypothetical protein
MMLRNLIPSIAAASTLTALLMAGTPASAAEQKFHLGPVGPYEPILATVGKKRLIAFYEPDGDNCAVTAVVFDATPNGGGHASTRVRVALHPGELFHLDAVKDQTVLLTCAPKAGMLTVLNQQDLLTKPARNVTN